jgi:hypothetical protein
VSRLAPYWKLIQFVLLAIGGTFAVDIRNGHISGKEWVTLGVYAAGAVVLFFKKNTPTQPHAKAVVAVFAAGVAAVTSAWTDNVFSPEEIVSVFLALVAAINTGTVANVPPGPQPEASGRLAGIARR